MALDFPNNPVEGQSFAGYGGILYRFDGMKWVPAPGFQPGTPPPAAPLLSSDGVTMGVVSPGVGLAITGNYANQILEITATGAPYVPLSGTQPGAPMTGAITMETYGADPTYTGNYVDFLAANGTPSSPQALNAGDAIGVITGGGYTGFEMLDNGQATINFFADQDWTQYSNPTRIELSATPAGYTAPGQPPLAQRSLFSLYNDGSAILRGGPSQGTLTVAREPEQPLEVATKSYVDAHSGGGGGNLPPAAPLLSSDGVTPFGVVNIGNGLQLQGAFPDQYLVATGGGGGGDGTVFSVTAGNGLTATPNNPITDSGTIEINPPVSYANGGTNIVAAGTNGRGQVLDSLFSLSGAGQLMLMRNGQTGTPPAGLYMGLPQVPVAQGGTGVASFPAGAGLVVANGISNLTSTPLPLGTGNGGTGAVNALGGFNNLGSGFVSVDTNGTFHAGANISNPSANWGAQIDNSGLLITGSLGSLGLADVDNNSQIWLVTPSTSNGIQFASPAGPVVANITAQGQLGLGSAANPQPNAGLYINGVPATTGVRPTVSWVAGTNPAGGVILRADKPMTITYISGTITAANTAPGATVSVQLVPNGASAPSQTIGSALNANGVPYTDQQLFLGSFNLNAGDRLVLSSGGTFDTSAAGIGVVIS